MEAVRFVFASDSFKGSLSSARTGELLTMAAREAFPDAECIAFPIADGGEGTLDAIRSVRVGELVGFDAHDGLMRPMEGSVFLCGEQAFVETATTCGLTLLEEGERDPLATTSYGLGECIRFALERGCEGVSVGLGGTDKSPASVDGVANSMLSVDPSVMAMRPKLFFQ